MLCPVAVERAQTEREDGDLPGIPPAPIVEWYRLDASRRIVGYLGVGSGSMLLGALTITRLLVATSGLRVPVGRSAAALSGMEPPFQGVDPMALALGATGFFAVVVGGAFALWGLQRVLAEESYLALRVDGALFVRGTTRRLLRWEDAEDVRFDNALGALVFVPNEGPEWPLVERFAGIELAELARRAAFVRRRALFGLYRR